MLFVRRAQRAQHAEARDVSSHPGSARAHRGTNTQSYAQLGVSRDSIFKSQAVLETLAVYKNAIDCAGSYRQYGEQ